MPKASSVATEAVRIGPTGAPTLVQSVPAQVREWALDRHAYRWRAVVVDEERLDPRAGDQLYVLVMLEPVCSARTRKVWVTLQSGPGANILHWTYLAEKLALDPEHDEWHAKVLDAWLDLLAVALERRVARWADRERVHGA